MQIYFKSKDGFVDEPFSFSKYGNKKFQVVGDHYNTGTNRFGYEAVKQANEESGLDVLLLNDKSEVFIIKFLDIQKFLYEQKKARKEQEKKQKASQQKVKEIKFHMNIAENDLKTKVDHVKKFLEENCKVKVVLELRGREIGMKDYAKEIWTNIVSNFSEYQIGERKEMNNSYFVFITR